ncbi:MAG TPA: vanadium-dependent haloperoxidase [Blastocatellia bacterium]|nr:vanadium-dependent haloperoxidase [Blastocatellia bacterium]
MRTSITTWRQAALASVLLFAAAVSASAAVPASADEVIRWNQAATSAAAAASTDPLTESRVFAILHVCIHDAVNAVDPRYNSYQMHFSAAGNASAEAAVAAAAHDVLVELLPSGRDLFDRTLEESLKTIVDGVAKTRGLEIGKHAAAAILAARKSDGANRSVEYRPGSKPGDYRPTPPDFTPAFMTQWGRITPFVLQTPAQFRPAPHPGVASAQALRDNEEVKVVGAKEGSVRTDEQSEIARYWYENSTQGWNRIAREVSATRKLNLWENARFFALVNLAMADGFIAGFEAKYYYNYWRPATAVRESGNDGWLSFLDTPPVPDYPSTHTVLGAAAATVMARFFGTDFVSFSTTSGAPYTGITRRFWSFSEAARENGASRVLAGIHFSTAVRAGYQQGESVGSWVFEHALRPVDARPVATQSSRASSR